MPLPDDDTRDIPPDNGRRASVDAKTGEVHGSGAGAGGGNPGEDLDGDQHGGGEMMPRAGAAPDTAGPVPKD